MLTEMDIYQIVFYLAILLILVKPLGWYMARVYENKSCGLDKIFSPIERGLYRICGIKPAEEMDWKKYLSAMLLFNLLGMLAVYLIVRCQFYFPLNPQNFSAPISHQAFNIAASFTSNTNWQSYAGESSMSYLTQMLAFTVQNFISAATGMSLLVAFIRGIARLEGKGLGNFWVDIIRGILYILLPLAMIFSLFLVSQGVIQNLKPYEKTSLLQASHSQQIITEHIIPMGPVASQVAIKQLGTNGGGFFNVNAAHPFENPRHSVIFLKCLPFC